MPSPSPVLTGFRVGDVAYGRPVGVIIAHDGSLLVADDAGGKVWRVSGAATSFKRQHARPLDFARDERIRAGMIFLLALFAGAASAFAFEPFALGR